MHAFIDYHDYRRHAEAYGYISTWCAWDELKRVGSEYVTARTEAEYASKNLGRTLHADVVVLGLNFGASPAWLERTGGKDPAKRLAVLRGKDPFRNMYGAMRPRYAPFFRGRCLWGAYATDFFKFQEGQLPGDLPVGVPTRNGGGIPARYFEPDLVKVQVEGIKNELAVLGCGDSRPDFILTSKKLLHPAVLEGLSSVFPDMRFARINHYQQRNARQLREALSEQIPAAHALFSEADGGE